MNLDKQLIPLCLLKWDLKTQTSERGLSPPGPCPEGPVRLSRLIVKLRTFTVQLTLCASTCAFAKGRCVCVCVCVCVCFIFLLIFTVFSRAPVRVCACVCTRCVAHGDKLNSHLIGGSFTRRMNALSLFVNQLHGLFSFNRAFSNNPICIL